MIITAVHWEMLTTERSFVKDHSEHISIWLFGCEHSKCVDSDNWE